MPAAKSATTFEKRRAFYCKRLAIPLPAVNLITEFPSVIKMEPRHV
jgi:hypothetical protein